MAKVLPFKGILYNKTKIKNLEAVMAPPYDVISPQMQEELHRSHPNNIVRIILGKESKKDTRKDNKYTRAAGFLEKWLKKSVLKRDKKSSIYVYEQEYLDGGKLKKRIGFISLLRIEDPSSSLVLPHEHTFSKPKEDRLNLIRRTGANTSPIFCIFQDENNKVTDTIREYAAKRKPIVDIHLEGVGHKIWNITDPGLVKRIRKGLDKKQVFIADGHHRYEVALNFRNEMRKWLGRRRAAKFDNVMVYFSNLSDDGLSVFSTYRVIKKIGGAEWSALAKKLSAYFTVEDVKNKEELFKGLEKAEKGYAFGVYFKNRRFYLLKLRDEASLDDVIKLDKSHEWKRLNVTVLHFLIFDHILHIEKFSSNDSNIIYTRDEDDAVGLVNKGECEIAFFQLPTRVSQVQSIAQGGEKMPHKSTYFYPKLLTGLVINKF